MPLPLHPRYQIRQAFVARLKTPLDNVYPTMAKDNIYASRTKPLFDQFLPAILVYTIDEQIESDQYDGDGYAPLVRKLSVDIEGAIKGSAQLDDVLDDLAFEIETALDGWQIPCKPSAVLHFASTDNAIITEGNKLYGIVRLTYHVLYRTSVKQPEST